MVLHSVPYGEVGICLNCELKNKNSERKKKAKNRGNLENV